MKGEREKLRPESERCEGMPELLPILVIFVSCLAQGEQLCYLYFDVLEGNSYLIYIKGT